jgi:hypothetical protein
MKHGNSESGDDFERLIALLALNSQALPKVDPSSGIDPSSQDLTTLSVENLSDEDKEVIYHYLDTNPDALAAYIDRHRLAEEASEPPVNESLFSSLANGLKAKVLIPSLALTLTVVGLVILLPFKSSLELDLNREFVELERQLDFDPQTVTMPWERGETGLGFSAPAVVADEFNVAFTLGLVDGIQQTQQHDLLAENVGLNASKNYLQSNLGKLAYDLGRWNILVTAAAINYDQISHDFWQPQSLYLQDFRKQAGTIVQSNTNTQAPVMINNDFLLLHLSKIEAVLTEIAAQQPGARNASALLRELEFFREATALTTIESFNQP